MERVVKVAAGATGVVGVLVLLAAFLPDLSNAHRYASLLLLTMPLGLLPLILLQRTVRGADGRWGAAGLVLLILATSALLLFSLVPIAIDLEAWQGAGSGETSTNADFMGSLIYAFASLAVACSAGVGLVGIGLLAIGMTRVSRRHSFLTCLALLAFTVLAYGLFLVLGDVERVGLLIVGAGLIGVAVATWAQVATKGRSTVPPTDSAVPHAYP